MCLLCRASPLLMTICFASYTGQFFTHQLQVAILFAITINFFLHISNNNVFQQMLPTDRALEYHVYRGQFLVKLVLDQDPVSNLYTDLGEGWIVDGEDITVKWDDDVEKIKYKKTSKPQTYSCSCKESNTNRCSGNGRGCKRCFLSCNACNLKCKCKGICDNPHNNGGVCSKCRILDDNSDTDCYWNESSDDEVDLELPQRISSDIEDDVQYEDTLA